MKEFLLVESSTLRQELCTDEHISVLDRVGQLVTLPGTAFATTQQVADFYLVDVEAIHSATRRHRDELKSDGYKVLPKKEFENGQVDHFEIPNRGLAIYPKRAVLRIGMILKHSEVAKEVRTLLLNKMEKPLELSDQKALTEMAQQLAQHAVASSKHSRMLSEHAAQIVDNSEQLVSQSKMVIALVNEVYLNRDRIDRLEKKAQSHDSKFLALETQPETIEYITPGQANILKAKVQAKAKGRKAVTIWGKFRSYFGLTRYKFLPQSKFKEACLWLDSYEE